MHKRKMFDITFDPTMQPGYASRFKSFDSLLGIRLKDTNEKAETIYQEGNLREKYHSGQVAEVLPSRMRRGK